MVLTPNINIFDRFIFFFSILELLTWHVPGGFLLAKKGMTKGLRKAQCVRKQKGKGKSLTAARKICKVKTKGKRK